MSDWQINNLLCDPEKEEPLSYGEALTHVWKLRGYSDDEVDQIVRWKQEGITDEVLWDRIKESIGARES